MGAILSLIVLLALSAALGLGQPDACAISGRITDGSDGIVPGAEVSFRNTSTYLVVAVKTNHEGLYESPPLPPGRYDIAIQKPGFERALANLELQVGQRPILDAELHIGDISQQVTVGINQLLLWSDKH